MVTSNLKPSAQCAKAAKKANMVLGQLARGVSYRDKVTFMRLYQVFVLPHLSYSVPAWAPYSKADMEVLERVQRRAVMMLTNVRGGYEERLTVLKMSNLQDRRVRGDMIETFKILTGKSQVDYTTWFNLASMNDGTVKTRFTAGNLNLALPPAPKLEIRRNLFSHSVIPVWNQHPDSFRQAQPTNQFKSAYDNHLGY